MLSSPDSALHILQWKMSEKCSFVSGFPHDLNAVYFTQDTCVCWAIIEEAFEKFAKDQAVKGMSNESEVPSGPEENECVGRCSWEEGEEKNGAVGKN